MTPSVFQSQIKQRNEARHVYVLPIQVVLIWVISPYLEVVFI